MVLQQKIDELIFNLDLRRNFDCLFNFLVHLTFRFTLKADINSNSHFSKLCFDSLLNEPISLIGYSLSKIDKGPYDSIMKNNRSLIVKYVTAIQHKT